MILHASSVLLQQKPRTYTIATLCRPYLAEIGSWHPTAMPASAYVVLTMRSLLAVYRDGALHFMICCRTMQHMQGQNQGALRSTGSTTTTTPKRRRENAWAKLTDKQAAV